MKFKSELAEARGVFDAATGTRHQTRTEAILKTASILFNSRGYSKTSLADVAGELGITKNALYYYVKNKDDLVYQCYLRAVEVNEAVMAKADRDGSNGREKLANWIRYLMDERNSSLSMMTEIPSLPEPHGAKLRARIHEIEINIRTFLKEGVKDGSLRGCDPIIAEFWIMGALSWVPQWYNPDGRKSAAQIAEEFVDFAMNGLATDRL